MPTGTKAALWRDESRRRLVLSFRGTSDLKDVLADVNVLQTPLEPRDDGGKSDDTRLVHSGFHASVDGGHFYIGRRAFFHMA